MHVPSEQAKFPEAHVGGPVSTGRDVNHLILDECDHVIKGNRLIILARYTNANADKMTAYKPLKFFTSLVKKIIIELFCENIPEPVKFLARTNDDWSD